jgi:hypothetical protein
MDKKELSVKDLSELIKISAKSGVSELKFGTLELRFGKPTEKAESKLSVKEITEEEHKNLTDEALEQDSIRLKKDQIDMLMVENPSEAERLLLNEDLDEYESGQD